MANFTSLPDGTTGTNNWSCSTGSDFVDLVDEDDDSTYIYETALNGEITYTLANPSVAEVDIDFNKDVTVTPKVHAHYTAPLGTVNMEITMTGTDSDGHAIVAPIQVCAIDNSAYPAYDGPSATNQSLAHGAWDYDGLENIQKKLKK